jgi:hypothetical protein
MIDERKYVTFKDGERDCPICSKSLPAHCVWPGARFRYCKHMASPFEQHMQPTIGIAGLLPRQLQQLFPQLRVVVGPRFVPVARPLHAQQLAGRAFAQTVLSRDERNIAS